MLDLKKFEDPNRPFLGPVIKYLTLLRLWLPDGFIQRCFAFSIQLVITLFIITEFVDFFYIDITLDLLLTNLKFSMQGVINFCKAWTFILWQKDWKEICDYITRTDIANRNPMNNKKKLTMERNTKYCRKVIYSYGFYIYTTAFVVIFQPALKYCFSQKYRTDVKEGRQDYMEVVSSWVPFNKQEMPGYLYACVIQGVGTLLAAGWILSYDMITVSIMIFFKAELQALKIDAAEVFDGENVLERIRDCHKRHIELLKFSRLFNSCISPILMLYTFVCTVMICSTAYQITHLESSTAQQLLMLVYLMFGVSQLFLYCWHSNDVYYASMDLARGPYDSTWCKQKPFHQRNIIILVFQFSKTVMFTAGPFTNLTVPLFINILKGAYSYYTLL